MNHNSATKPIMQHAIHAIIVFIVLGLGSKLLPRFFYFSNPFGILLGVAFYMVLYVGLNRIVGKIAARSFNFAISTPGFLLFMLVNLIPSTIALALLATIYGGFWACNPWLVALIVTVVCEAIFAIGAFVQER